MPKKYETWTLTIGNIHIARAEDGTVSIADYRSKLGKTNSSVTSVHMTAQQARRAYQKLSGDYRD